MIDLEKFEFNKYDPFNDVIPDQLNKMALAGDFYNLENPYTVWTQRLFDNGGIINFKEGVDSNSNIIRFGGPYALSLLKSFEHPHQDKIAVAALILSQFVKID